MTIKRQPRTLLFALALAATGAAPLTAIGPSTAVAQAAKKIDFATLQKYVAGLGLEDTGDQKTYIAVTGINNTNYIIGLQLSDNGSYIVISVRWEAVTADKKAKIPAIKMLEYNNTHLFEFELSTEKDGASSIVLSGNLDAEAVNPINLRRYFEVLVQSADETQDLWDPEKWASASAKK